MPPRFRQFFVLTIFVATQAGWCLLHTVAVNDHDSIGKFLISEGLNVNAVGKVNETPLHICAVSGSKRMTSLLLKNGADPLLADGEGWCPIHYAARFGDRDVLEALINAQTGSSTGSGSSPNSKASTVKEDCTSSVNSSDSDASDGCEAHSLDSASIATKEEGWTAVHIATHFEQVSQHTLPDPVCTILFRS